MSSGKPYEHSYEDVKSVGPGIWWTLHSYAFSVDTLEKWDGFQHLVRLVETQFPGLECRSEFKAFHEKHPLRTYIGHTYRGRPSGAFEWTVEAHNEVNERNKKRIMPLDEAWGIFEQYDQGHGTACWVQDLFQSEETGNQNSSRSEEKGEGLPDPRSFQGLRKSRPNVLDPRGRIHYSPIPLQTNVSTSQPSRFSRS